MQYLLNLWNELDFGSMGALLLRLTAVFLCLTVHEVSHGLAAYALGDPTARRQRRLSLNPLHHIDWLGLGCMVFCGFGWAKPVPVNLRYVKNARLASAVISISGPLSNILLAFIGVFFYILFYGYSLMYDHTALVMATTFFYVFSSLNVGYAVFNMLPVPPLDGSRILTSLIPRRWAAFSFKYERYSGIIFLILLYFGAFTDIISTGINFVFGWIYRIVALFPFEIFF